MKNQTLSEQLRLLSVGVNDSARFSNSHAQAVAQLMKRQQTACQAYSDKLAEARRELSKLGMAEKDILSRFI